MDNHAEIRQTSRGFEIIEFLDMNEKPCVLQQSSVAIYEQPGSSAVHLGRDGERMHLNLEMVGQLVAALQNWIKNGSFVEKDEEEDRPLTAVAIPQSALYAIWDELKAAYQPHIQYDPDPAENTRRALAATRSHVHRAMDRLASAAPAVLGNEPEIKEINDV